MENLPSVLRPVWLLPLLISSLLAQQPPTAAAPAGRIPIEPMREPHFTPAAKADFLKGEDQVVGVSAYGVSKAYPRRIIAWHHIVQDQLGNIPILATWCNLCSSGIVFKNDVDGRKLTPELAGTRGSNLTFRDRETGSQWQQATGEAFAGSLKGRHLEMIPFVF